jgi:hypothetical protein
MSPYLTAVQERNLVTKFRQHVIGLPPGSRVEWRDMDAWAEANFPVSVWMLTNHAMIPLPGYWEDLCVGCMSISEKLEKEAWLAFSGSTPRDWAFPITTTGPTRLKRSHGSDWKLMRGRALGIGGQPLPIEGAPNEDHQ